MSSSWFLRALPGLEEHSTFLLLPPSWPGLRWVPSASEPSLPNKASGPSTVVDSLSSPPQGEGGGWGQEAQRLGTQG